MHRDRQQAHQCMGFRDREPQIKGKAGDLECWGNAGRGWEIQDR